MAQRGRTDQGEGGGAGDGMIAHVHFGGKPFFFYFLFRNVHF